MKKIYYLFLLMSSLLAAQDIETLSWKEARLNSRIELDLSQKDFERRYKKADSTAVADIGETCIDQDDETVMILYFKAAKFELHGGRLKFKSVDFTKKRSTYLEFEDDWFDHTTTLKSFKRTYPVASEFILDDETDDGQLAEMITLLPTEPAEEFEWRFYFVNGRLHSIIRWEDCNN